MTILEAPRENVRTASGRFFDDSKSLQAWTPLATIKTASYDPTRSNSPYQERLPLESVERSRAFGKIAVSSTRLANHSVSPANGEQLAILPDNDFELPSVGKAQTLRLEAISTAHWLELQERLTTYEPYWETAYKELSAEDGAEKQLAKVAIKSLLVPLAYERRKPIFPRGLYKIGDDIYRRDQTGFFTVGDDPFGQRDYLTLVSFKDPCEFTWAGDEAWMNLGANLLSAYQQNQATIGEAA